MRCYPRRSSVVCMLLAGLICFNVRQAFLSFSVTPADKRHVATTQGSSSSGRSHNMTQRVSEHSRPAKTNQTKKVDAHKDHQVKVHGHIRQKQGFLTIGIPTISRVNGDEYLLQTLASVVKMTSEQDKEELVVVVFLADFSTSAKNKTLTHIAAKYANHLNSGFMRVVEVAREYYPKLDHLKQNFRDKKERVTWRAKQVADYAFLFLHSANISRYYLQLEDDVVCGQYFVHKIKQYISKQRKPWTCLEFSELGFIGKLFKSSDLHKLAQFMLLFYEEQPVDWLIRYFRMTMAQPDVRLRKPTLFQHMGLKSSFDTHRPNKLKDRFFAS